MSEPEFDDHWNEVSHLLTELITTFDLSTLNKFKSDNVFSNSDQKQMLEAILVKGIVKWFFYESHEYQPCLQASARDVLMMELFLKM